MSGGWETAFSSPSEVINYFNTLGFENGPYKACRFPPPNFMSSGTLVALAPLGQGLLEGNIGLYLYGTSHDVLDEIRLKMNINDPIYSEQVKLDALAIMKGFFEHFGINAYETVINTLELNADAEISLGDAMLKIDRLNRDIDNPTRSDYSMVLIFYRTGTEPQSST